jgi:hypothetical protein
MAANETQEPDSVIKSDRLVTTKCYRLLSSKGFWHLKKFLENVITRKIYFHILGQ